jgi:hypothetical protein
MRIADLNTGPENDLVAVDPPTALGSSARYSFSRR